jgi:hypothetical protein
LGAATKEVLDLADEHARQRANVVERERIVRNSCAWRVLGRVVGAGALVTGATVVASPTLAIMWCVAAWRVVKPIKEVMRAIAGGDPTVSLAAQPAKSSARS